MDKKKNDGNSRRKADQIALAMDKWFGMLIAHGQIMLGLQLNTRKLVVGITIEYIDQVRNLFDDHWEYDKRKFIAGDMQKLVGKIARLGEGANWIWKLMSHLYASLFSLLVDISSN